MKLSGKIIIPVESEPKLLQPVVTLQSASVTVPSDEAALKSSGYVSYSAQIVKPSGYISHSGTVNASAAGIAEKPNHKNTDAEVADINMPFS